MKRTFILGVCLTLFWLSAFAAPEIIMQADGTDSDLISYVQSELSDKLSNVTNKRITVMLTQEGDKLTINYAVTPDNGIGQEIANDIWLDLDATIQRVVNAIKNRTYTTQTNADFQNSLKQEDEQEEVKPEKPETSYAQTQPVIPQESTQQQTQQQPRQKEEVSQRSQQQVQTPSYQQTSSYTSASSKKEGQNIFLGVNGAFGMSMDFGYSSYWNGYYNSQGFGVGLNVKAGVDFAWPVANRFAIGAYLTLGGGPAFKSKGRTTGGMDFKAGLLMLFGDLNYNPYIFGVSPCIGFGLSANQGYMPLELRFGRIIKEHLYITGNLTLGIPFGGGFVMEPAVTVGYHFGDRFKK